MNKMLSGMQGLPPGFPPLPVLPPQSYYPPAPMHTAPYQGGPSFQQGFPSSGYGQQTPQSTLSFAGQQFVPYPYTSGYYGQSFSDVGGSLGAGLIPARSGAVSAAMQEASVLRADSDDTKTGLPRPVSFHIHRV
nr:DNA helicase [Bacillus velezensis]